MSRPYREIVANENGMALLITIMVISLLVVVTLKINSITRGEWIASANYKDKIELSAIVLSGINMAEAVLEKDLEDNEYDSPFDSWALLSEEKFPALFMRGTLSLDIEDLSAKFQINSLVNKAPDPQNSEEPVANKSIDLFKRLLLSGPFQIEEESRAIEIVDAIIDWIDADDRESDYGAEDSYYQSLVSPYDCKNAPIEFVEELLLIKGITTKLLYGSGDRKGLSHYITAHGNDGKINVNSADALILEALDPDMSKELAEGMVEFRALDENKDQLAAPDWYLKVSSWPGDIVLDQKLITTTSSYFKIKATGTNGTLTKKMNAIVHRDGKAEGIITLLARKVE